MKNKSNIMDNIVLLSKVGNKFYRIITYKYYNYFDELGGSIETDKAPEFREAYVNIQVKCRFLFIPYWKTLRTYNCKVEKSIKLQEYNAKKWFNKNIYNG